jgi:uncharacterized protein
MTEDVGERAGGVPSPCVRICCLDENDICLGCYRTISEICGWGAATDQEKLEILRRCRARCELREESRKRIS